MDVPQENILFSIIIPTYNRGERIKATLLSALNQDFGNHEVIVVDDGSTDNTEEVIKTFHNHRLKYFKKENRERAAARNLGADKAKGEYVTFLDSDDILYPIFLQNAYETMLRYNHPPFFHLAYEIKNEQGKVLAKADSIKSDDYKFLIYGNPLSCIGAFVKREIFKSIRFNEDLNLTLSEDWELWLRLVANYGIKTDNRISAAMIAHTTRSVLNTDENKLVLRKQLSFNYSFRDLAVHRKYQMYYNKMQSYFDIYIALHLALGRMKKRALVYLSKAFFANPGLILKKRFYAVVKHLII